MLVLDTDHLSILQWPGPRAQQLGARLVAAETEIATTIISVEEQLQGWLTELHRFTANPDRQVPYYARLDALIHFFSQWRRLPFDSDAVARYQQLRQLRLRSIGPKDLKIAAIVQVHNATLLSANLRHFRLVPDLQVEDWSS